MLYLDAEGTVWALNALPRRMPELSRKLPYTPRPFGDIRPAAEPPDEGGPHPELVTPSRARLTRSLSDVPRTLGDIRLPGEPPEQPPPRVLGRSLRQEPDQRAGPRRGGARSEGRTHPKGASRRQITVSMPLLCAISRYPAYANCTRCRCSSRPHAPTPNPPHPQSTWPASPRSRPPTASPTRPDSC